MSPTVRRIAIAAGVLLVIVLLLPRLVNVNTFRPKLEAVRTGLTIGEKEDSPT